MNEVWELVAGESPIDSARRELEEETGVQVTKEKLTYLGKTIMNEYQCIMYNVYIFGCAYRGCRI